VLTVRESGGNGGEYEYEEEKEKEKKGERHCLVESVWCGVVRRDNVIIISGGQGK
jgi:hypothetical protein